MDPLSVAGLVLAALAILGGQALEGGHLGSLLQPAAALIVIGGTFAAVLIHSRPPTFVAGVKLARWALQPPRLDVDGFVARVERWATTARRDGILSLEREIPGVVEPFEREGLQLLVDGMDPERIRETLEIEIDASEARLRAAAKVWEAAGGTRRRSASWARSSD